MKRSRRALLLSFLLLLTLAAPAVMAATAGPEAMRVSVDFGKSGANNFSVPIQILLLFTVLSLAPAILIMTTSFVRIVIVFSFLRSALTLQQPSNQVVLSLALFLTAFIMAPTWQGIDRDAIQPWQNKKISGEQAMDVGAGHLKTFMLRYTRETDLRLFLDMSSKKTSAERAQDLPLQVIIPAYMLSELRTGFQMGLLIMLPFLVIDLVVSSILMTLGMMMLPPPIVALPLKIMVFVLVDGWTLIVRSILQSFR